MFSTRLDPEALKRLRHLAVDLEKPISALMEEAIEDLLVKYKKSPAKDKAKAG